MPGAVELDVQGAKENEIFVHPTFYVQHTQCQNVSTATVIVRICFLNKGYNYEVDSYSAFYNNGGFENTEMEEELDKKNVGKVQ